MQNDNDDVEREGGMSKVESLICSDRLESINFLGGKEVRIEEERRGKGKRAEKEGTKRRGQATFSNENSAAGCLCARRQRLQLDEEYKARVILLLMGHGDEDQILIFPPSELCTRLLL